jgi:hypothetical protein
MSLFSPESAVHAINVPIKMRRFSISRGKLPANSGNNYTEHMVEITNSTMRTLKTRLSPPEKRERSGGSG